MILIKRMNKLKNNGMDAIVLKDYYHKANLFYTDKMDLLIDNKHQDKELFDMNVKKIGEYIMLNKEENNGI